MPETSAPRCAWAGDAGELRKEAAGSVVICGQPKEAMNHQHSLLCPRDHAEELICHAFAATEASAPNPPATGTVDPTKPHKCWCQHGYAAESEGIPPLTTPPATGTGTGTVQRIRDRVVRLRPGLLGTEPAVWETVLEIIDSEVARG